MTPDEVNEWGWRVPFIGSLVFVVGGYYLRRGIQETEAGLKAMAASPPLFPSLVADWRPILQTFGIVAMTNAAYYLTFTYAVERRKALAGASGDEFLLANTLSLLVTSMSFACSITLALAGGTAPMVATWLVDTLHQPLAPAFYVMAYGAIGLMIMWPMAETNARPLDR